MTQRAVTGRLFWKIFLGFWLTIILIFEGVWLLYEVLRPVPSDLTASLARISLGAASSAIEMGGYPALKTQIASWPVDERGRVSVHPWTTTSVIHPDIQSGVMSVKARDPQGQAYWVGYNVTKFRFANHSPIDIPREIIALALVAGLGFSGALAWYLTKPARQMQIGFNRLSAGDFTTRLGPAVGRRKDEIADLARGFDEMAARLQDVMLSRDRLLADVSHELRSPLARLQLAIDLARQSPDKMETSLERVREEASRLDELVGELLTLSKLEHGASSEPEYFDLAQVVTLAVEDAKYEATPKGVTVVSRIDGNSTEEWLAVGRGRLMSRVVENILRNAIRFSRTGQTVEVRLVNAAQGYHLTIADQGPGVPSSQVGNLFKPFMQAVTGDGQGFGLGLSIAQRAVTALGGSIKAANGDPQGFVVTIALPHVPA